MDLVVVRFLFVLIIAVTCYLTDPFDLPARLDAGVGALIGLAIVLFEWRLRRVSLKRLIGAAIGSVLGIFGAYLFSLVIRNSIAPGHTQSFLQILVMLLMAYVGLVVGANKGDLLNLAALGGVFGGEKQGKKSYKILDTSVIIDGRIADIAETGFLDGIIVTPQFVLRELQLVADSADSLKRNRGRRGLDILQRLQKVASLQIQIVEDDFPAVREVDLKLIELAKLYEGKIITNDFNLNKVAQLQGVAVLNINELANSLKPIVLPGETMKVFILKEGKEYNQGVAYLDAAAKIRRRQPGPDTYPIPVATMGQAMPSSSVSLVRINLSRYRRAASRQLPVAQPAWVEHAADQAPAPPAPGSRVTGTSPGMASGNPVAAVTSPTGTPGWTEREPHGVVRRARSPAPPGW